MSSGKVEQVEEIITPILEGEGMELVDLEFKKEGPRFFLRIFIDKEGGVSLDDCQNISEQVGELLDVEEVISQAFTLEVSSPGVERPLKKLADFERFKGKKAKVKLFQPLEGEKVFQGTIESVEGETIGFKKEQKEKIVHCSIGDISKANLVFDFGK